MGAKFHVAGHRRNARFRRMYRPRRWDLGLNITPLPRAAESRDASLCNIAGACRAVQRRTAGLRRIAHERMSESRGLHSVALSPEPVSEPEPDLG